MITINKNKINNVPFTLKEKTTNNVSGYVQNGYIQPGYFLNDTFYPVFYLLELYSNSNRDSKVLKLGIDQSVNIDRWNEFIIEENDIEDLDNGIISLESGTYDYFVWQSNSNSILLEEASHIVESGKCVVPGIEKISNTFKEKVKEHTFK